MGACAPIDQTLRFRHGCVDPGWKKFSALRAENFFNSFFLVALTLAALTLAANAAPQGRREVAEKKSKKMLHFGRFDVSDFFVHFRAFLDVFDRFRALTRCYHSD